MSSAAGPGRGGRFTLRCFRRVIEKAFAYLEASTQMVWIVEPTSQTVRVYRSETPIRVLGIDDTLTGEDIVEGFSCQVAQLFE